MTDKCLGLPRTMDRMLKIGDDTHIHHSTLADLGAHALQTWTRVYIPLSKLSLPPTYLHQPSQSSNRQVGVRAASDWGVS